MKRAKNYSDTKILEVLRKEMDNDENEEIQEKKWRLHTIFLKLKEPNSVDGVAKYILS